MAEGTSNDYVVLARKYRSRTFAELIGQDALVRTLTNAIASDRIHHAYVLTGIRGVGKTSTARLLAMALNCENGPAVTWDDNDAQVAAIRAGTHMDVLEFDAASNRGVEDIADLFSGVNYAPVSGRYKVYIIDEVHMLSTHAFNALLKTLEEPPAKVKFIFATTEVQKIPVTVLSRCQRFDLKRIPSDVLQGHFTQILEKEGISAEPEAVVLIAKAADGSVRDGLSLLDQAIALSHGAPVKAALVQDMLGLADRVRVYELLEALLGGEPSAALAVLDDLYAGGQDALLVVQGLLDVLHLVTRLKIVPGLAESPAVSELERTRGGALAARLGLANLSRAYQLLAQAAAEVKQAERPYEALSMAAVRVAYLAPLPGLDKLAGDAVQVVTQAAAAAPLRSAGAMAAGVLSGANVSQPVAVMMQPGVEPTPARAGMADVAAGDAPGHGGAAGDGPAPWEGPAAPALSSWKDVVRLVDAERRGLAGALAAQVRCLAFDASGAVPELVVQVDKGLHDGKDLVRQLKEVLKAATGQNWQIELAAGEAAAGVSTLMEVRAQEGAQRREAAGDDPLVRAAMQLFPGAVVEDVKVADQ